MTRNTASKIYISPGEWTLDAYPNHPVPSQPFKDVRKLAYALNFKQPRTDVPSLPKPGVPFLATPCFQNLVGGMTAAKAPSGAGSAVVRFNSWS